MTVDVYQPLYCGLENVCIFNLQKAETDPNGCALAAGSVPPIRPGTLAYEASFKAHQLDRAGIRTIH